MIALALIVGLILVIPALDGHLSNWLYWRRMRRQYTPTELAQMHENWLDIRQAIVRGERLAAQLDAQERDED